MTFEEEYHYSDSVKDTPCILKSTYIYHFFPFLGMNKKWHVLLQATGKIQAKKKKKKKTCDNLSVTSQKKNE